MVYLDFIAGCFGGAAGVLAGHPLDTVKVRLQTQTPGQYKGTVHCFTSIVRNEGVSGLLKGLSSPLASLSVINAIVFGVYGNAVRLFENQESIWTHFVAGCASGLAQTVIATPTEMLKLRMQIQSDSCLKVYRSPYDCLRKIIKQKGIKYLFRGSIATQLRDTPAFGIYFASYDYMARHFSKDGTMESLTSVQLLIAGGGAGMLSWLFNYPTDVIKTKFQADDTFKSYWEAIAHTYRTQGYRGFLNGLNSTLLRAFPSNAATFFAVEWSYRLMLDLQEMHQKRVAKQQPKRFVATKLDDEKVLLY
uniref:Mitochondrial basic amino acids transporter n=1 Tax=Ascaris suum TaxID=6253 RepID=F1L6P6_ASCSU